MQIWSVVESTGGFLAKKSTKTQTLALVGVGAGIDLVVYLPVSWTLGIREAMGDGIPDVLESTSAPSSSSVVQVGKFSQCLDQCRSISSNRFVLNMVKGYHLQVRCHPLLFHNFKWFNIEAASAHHPVIQKEVDELIAKGPIEPLTCGAGF